MRYTSQQEFAFGALVDLRAIIPDTGTSVTVEFWTGTEWVIDSQSPITSPDQVFTRGVNMRLTPDIGGYYVEESQQ